jgi:hypothetical protein
MRIFKMQIIKHINAARSIASTFGFLSGIGCILHGIGEVLQGNIKSEGIFIESWKIGPIAEHMGGDPGITLIPNMLITGIVCLVISLVLIIWSIFFINRKKGGLIQLLLVLILLLTGGGVGPPTLGILAGFAGLGIHAKYKWWSKILNIKIRRFLAGIWPWIFAITVLNGIFLIIGHIILVFYFGYANADMFLNSFFFAFFSILLSIFVGIAYDIDTNIKTSR